MSRTGNSETSFSSGETNPIVIVRAACCDTGVDREANDVPLGHGWSMGAAGATVS
jgi:hypothetical protein